MHATRLTPDPTNATAWPARAAALNWRQVLLSALLVATWMASVVSAVESTNRPNIVLAISDDQSWLHTGVSGCKAVKTPHFDQVVAQGVLFTHAFVSSPGCAPSRGAILSGQAFWRLREGAVQRSTFPGDIRVYPDLLAEAGYHVGLQGKGWGPGLARQRPHNPAGKAYRSFEQFLDEVPADKPFCFWFGSLNPHRPYAPGSGLKAGKKLEDAVVPPFLPDVPEVRSDLLDYYAEIDDFDRELGRVLTTLEKSGRAADTLVIVAGDNGMPFPRGKTNLYDCGVRVPLAVRWPARVAGGRVVDDFVSLADCAPTILRAAGLQPLPEMTARSFLDVLLSGKSGRVDPLRDHVLFGRERHGASWPCRALRNEQFLYIRNFAPERLDGLACDTSPSKDFLFAHQEDPRYERYYKLSYGPRGDEELYDVRVDPGQVTNLASQPAHATTLQRMRAALESALKQAGDPRILGRGSEFDNYPGIPSTAKPAAKAQTRLPSEGTPDAAERTCDLAVIGGGSGGFGAALAAARLGLDVVLVEKGDCLGGTSVRGGVNCWEMGAGGTGIPFELYKQLKDRPQAVAVYSFGRHASTFDPQRESFRYPGGETVSDPKRRYIDTLQRHVPRGDRVNAAYRHEHWHGIPFEPAAMAETMLAMLTRTGHCRVLLNTAFADATARDGRVAAVRLSDGGQLRARYFVDATGDGLLCLVAGCSSMVGQQSRAEYSEPDAPEVASSRVNGVTLIYRAAPVDAPGIEPLPDGIPTACWWEKKWPSAHVNHYPNGDLNINMLPTMEGEEFVRLGHDAAYAECQRRVRAHWHDWQTRIEEFRRFRLSWIAPVLGVRETRRIVGEYVLTENDLLAGLSQQPHPDIICLADHMMDTHGSHSRHPGELSEPYGVPYRCLIPKGSRNLLIACRGASFTSLAASSCRLSRTMMQLGQAAGTAAALAKKLGVDLPDVPAGPLRAALVEQHVQLEHPMPEALRAYLSQE